MVWICGHEALDPRRRPQAWRAISAKIGDEILVVQGQRSERRLAHCVSGNERFDVFE